MHRGWWEDLQMHADDATHPLLTRNRKYLTIHICYIVTSAKTATAFTLQISY